MGWLLHNPIADLRGPQFLVLYGLTILFTVLWARRCVRKQDTTQDLPPPAIPAEMDPYELAYLRAGEHEILRLALISLLQRGYLKFGSQKGAMGTTKEVLERLPGHPDERHLSPVESLVFPLFSNARSAEEILKKASGTLGLLGRQYAEKLEQAQLMPTASQRSMSTKAGLSWGWVFLLLAAYKLCIALSRGHHNVGFMILMSIAGMVALYQIARPQRLTHCGRAYLAELQLALSRMKDNVERLVTEESPHLLLPVAAFGIGILEATSMAYYPKMFQRGASAGTGDFSSSSGNSGGAGCGSSSSSCSGGSSCGGGGGCGGCGS